MNSNKIIDHISKWLLDYSMQSKTNGFVIGVSGGVDSAVTSTLGAITGQPIICIEMPIHQEVSQVNRAVDHINWLKEKFDNVHSTRVDLTQVFDQMVQELPRGDNDTLAMANTRARLRMTTLYHIASQKGMLVLGTGNKVEDFGVGFFTKYGDGGVDLSPIADLNKSEVFALGRELGIIQSILTAAPTDGLFGDDRTDEDQLGASYPELEWAMEFTGNEAALSERQTEVLKIYRRLNAANRHKMIPIPVCAIPSSLR